ncbi:hypothetical protein I5R57_07420 [Staphylococcus haemolyticus]|uniref:hypothetical protein n=1 Tax=Staphylococcus haemolyticus TaxID=1283 RepID=UPI0018C8061E|nr:hypothetical protein [Staphylococcus haemolyticus]MBG3869795.1 hypothetical protein [Staphylococcus haemolyticus]
MAETIEVSKKDFNKYCKDSIDLVLLANDYKFLERQYQTAQDHIEELQNDIKFYMELYQSADARADRADKRLEEYIDARANIKL